MLSVGFASYDDIAKTLKRMLLCKDEREGLQIVAKLDPTYKGYLGFD